MGHDFYAKKSLGKLKIVVYLCSKLKIVFNVMSY